jgi:hypothetical protein
MLTVTRKILLCAAIAPFFAGALYGGETAESGSGPNAHSQQKDKPVQVFILMGQSNMFGSGKVKGESTALSCHRYELSFELDLR